jgi:hypothetical protein
MGNRLFIGLTAGFVAAVLYVTVGTGTLFALILYFLTPLPLFIAGLGWGALTAAAGSGAGTVLTTVVFGFDKGMQFLVTVAVPVVILTYFALLSRTGELDGKPTVDWYPLGRLLLWIAGLSAALIGFGVIIIGPDTASFESTMRELFSAALRANPDLHGGDTPMPAENLNQLVEMLVTILPPASATWWMLMMVAIMIVASKVVQQSGHTIRQADDCTNLDLPMFAAPLLGAAFAVSFLPGLAGIIAISFTATLVVAFALQGLAVIHVITRGNPIRPALLGLAYLMFFGASLIGVPMLAATGMAETFFRLRDRFSRGNGPPTTSISI